MELRDFKTCELVEELKKRDGVDFKIIEPYEKLNFNPNEIGPMTILKIID